MSDTPGGDSDVEHEELETIPWTMLAEHMEHRRLRGYARYAVALVVGVVIVIAGTSLTRRPSGTVVEFTSPAVTAPVEGVAAPPAGSAPAQTSAPETPQRNDATTQTPGIQDRPSETDAVTELAPPVGTPPAAALYSEADLMADLPHVADFAQSAVRRAMMAAEWYVIDHFTMHDGAGAAAWVEWAIAADVRAGSHRENEGRGAGTAYDVTVGFQTLLTSGDGAFERTPPRAVVVTLEAGDDGRLRIIDFPRPAEFAMLVSVDVGDPSPGTPPPQVVDDAFAALAPMGDSPQLVGAEQLDDGSWRVVVSVADSVGLRAAFAVVVE